MKIAAQRLHELILEAIEEVVHEKKDPKVGTGKKPKGSGRRLYTDEDPSDTVSVKFSTVQDIKDTFSKASFKSKSHKRQSQIINLVHQRVRAAHKRAKDPEVKARLGKALKYAVKRKEASKQKTKRMQKEAVTEKKLARAAALAAGLAGSGCAALGTCDQNDAFRFADKPSFQRTVSDKTFVNPRLILQNSLNGITVAAYTGNKRDMNKAINNFFKELKKYYREGDLSRKEVRAIMVALKDKDMAAGIKKASNIIGTGKRRVQKEVRMQIESMIRNALLA